MIDTFAPDALIQLIADHSGHATTQQLKTAGFAGDVVQAWVRRGMLERDSSGSYRLAEPEVYIDWLILALWDLPQGTQGIVGGVTALEYYGASVAWVNRVDVGIRQGTQLPPASARLRPFVIPENLWGYGAEIVTPSLPGNVAIPMYSLPVALVQTLRDPTYDLDTVTDAVMRYLSIRGEDEALRDAVSRYDVEHRLLEINQLNALALG